MGLLNRLKNIAVGIVTLAAVMAVGIVLHYYHDDWGRHPHYNSRHYYYDGHRHWDRDHWHGRRWNRWDRWDRWDDHRHRRHWR